MSRSDFAFLVQLLLLFLDRCVVGNHTFLFCTLLISQNIRIFHILGCKQVIGRQFLEILSFVIYTEIDAYFRNVYGFVMFLINLCETLEAESMGFIVGRYILKFSLLITSPCVSSITRNSVVLLANYSAYQVFYSFTGIFARIHLSSCQFWSARASFSNTTFLTNQFGSCIHCLFHFIDDVG